MANLIQGIDRLPGSVQPHRLADWAELLCFASAEGELTAAELADRFEAREDYQRHEMLDASEPGDEDEKVPTDLVDPPEGGSFEAERDDRHARRANEVFRYVNSRVDAFGSTYPFAIENNGRRLVLQDSTIPRGAYLFLLTCALLRYVTNSGRSDLTSQFEKLCTLALKKRLPIDAEVHLFGAGPHSDSSIFGTLLVDKIQKLAEILGERATFDPSDFDPRDTGDHGLDIVAFLPPGDSISSKISFFGQCACTEEWVSKQFSSSDDAWGSLLTLMTRPANLCFIPFDFRRVDRTWHRRKDIKRTHLIDRSRLLHDLGLLNGVRDAEELQEIGETVDLAAIEACRQQELADL